MADRQKRINAFKRMANSLNPSPAEIEYLRKKQEVKMLGVSLTPGPHHIEFNNKKIEVKKLADLLTPGIKEFNYFRKKQNVMMLGDSLTRGPEHYAYCKKKLQVKMLVDSLIRNDVDEGELVTDSDDDYSDAECSDFYSSEEEEEPYDKASDFENLYGEDRDLSDDGPQFGDVAVSLDSVVKSIKSLHLSTETHNDSQAAASSANDYIKATDKSDSQAAASSTNDYIRATDKSASEIQLQIEKLTFGIALSIIEGKVFAYDVPSRARSNQHFDPDLRAILLKKKMFKRSYYIQPRKVTITLRVLSIINNLLIESAYISKRELFYTDKNLFKTQRQSDGVLDDICCMMECTRNSLHVVAEKRGYVIGQLSYKEDDKTCDCSTIDHPIPSSISRVTSIESNAKFILLVEKYTVFMRLAYEKFHNAFPCIIITAKGQPDIATRMFLRKLKLELQIPVYALMDCDPDGIKIMLVYAYGSQSKSYNSEDLVTPGIKWLGLLPSDLDTLRIPKRHRMKMTDRDLRATNILLDQNYVKIDTDMVKELQWMKDNKQKAEIECLSTLEERYLTRVYLPKKLRAMSSSCKATNS